MILTSSEQESIEELQQQRKKELENLDVKIKQASARKENAFNKYKKLSVDIKKLKKKLRLLEKSVEKDQKAINCNEEEYGKPSNGEINIVVRYINQRLITRSEGAETLRIPYSTMCKYVQKNGVKPRPKSHKPPNLKILDEHIVELMNYIEKEPNATQPMMCEHLKNKCGISVSQSSISRILKSLKN